MGRQVISLKGTPREETGFRAAAALTPGMLVEWDASNDKGVIPHGTSGGTIAPIMIVREQHEYLGHGIDDVIAHQDSCTVMFPGLGDEVNMITAASLNRGDRIASAGNGKVILATSGMAVLGVASGATNTDSTIHRVAVIIGSCQAE